MDRYVKVYDWMLELGLKPGELLAYAVIFSFGKDGDWYTGSASYLGKWMGIKKKHNVIHALASLVQKGLLEKREKWEKGQKMCDYRPCPNRAWGGPKKGTGAMPKKGPGPMPDSGIHNNRPDSNRPYSDSDKEEINNKEVFVHLSVDEWRKTHR